MDSRSSAEVTAKNVIQEKRITMIEKGVIFAVHSLKENNHDQTTQVSDVNLRDAANQRTMIRIITHPQTAQ